MNKLLDGLNDAQRQSVISESPSILIVAGPGTGKTRSITHRIAYLIAEKGVDPHNILAMTFTRKAATEMQNRVKELCGKYTRVTINTYHGFCASLLRRYIGRDITIWDESDQRQALKMVNNPWRMSKTHLKPQEILDFISEQKTNRIDPVSPTSYMERVQTKARGKRIEPAVPALLWDLLDVSYYTKADFNTNYSEIVRHNVGIETFMEGLDQLDYMYMMYEHIRKQSKGYDYDDLLLEALNTLTNNQRAREQQHRRYSHIIVDEYQDTDPLQYTLLKLLRHEHANVCVVGDPDQSIYKFRGADYSNIMNYEGEFGADVLKLNVNYRSTSEIIDVSQEMIKHNAYRIDNPLLPSREHGLDITLKLHPSIYDELEWIADEIDDIIRAGAVEPKDIAILSRSNRVAQAFDKYMIERQIPYQVVGGVNFFERVEVRYITRWLKFLQNNADDVVFTEILTEGRNRIGPKTIDSLVEQQREEHIPLWQLINNVKPFPALTTFINQVNDLIYFPGDLPSLVSRIRKNYDMPPDIKNDVNRVARQEVYEKLTGEYRDENWRNILFDWLARVNLYDSSDDIGTENSVTISTIHKAKGLEWPCVFVPAVVYGSFPHANDITPADVEESRRTFYVALTRAMDLLYISTNLRMFDFSATPSPFLMDNCINTLRPQLHEIQEYLDNRHAINHVKRYR